MLAQDEARALGLDWIGTEHQLLALLRGGNEIVRDALDGLTVEAVREDVEARSGRGASPDSGQIPFTPAAKEALEQALREALALGHNVIGTEHLLLGLVRVDDVAASILRGRGLAPDAVHATVVAAFSGSTASPWEHAVDNVTGSSDWPAIAQQLVREGWEIVSVQIIRRRRRA